MLKCKNWLLLLSPLTYSVGLFFSSKVGFLGFLASIFSALFFFFIVFLAPKNRYDKSINIAVYLFLVFVVFSLIFTMDTSYSKLRAIFLNSYFVLPYLSIIIVTRKFDGKNFTILIDVLAISAIIFILFSFINLISVLKIDPRQAYYYLVDRDISFDVVSKRLYASTGFLILLLPLIKTKYKIIAIVAFLLNFTFAVFLARRNIIFTNSLFLLLSIYNLISFSKFSKFTRSILKFFLFCCISGVLLNLVSVIESERFDIFSNLASRLDKDTRSDVTNAFYNDMNNNPIQWIIGKGINSEYYCPNVEDKPYRETVETGWQHITLKLGLIGLFLMLYILIQALRKKSNNILIVSSKMYILTYVLELFPAGVPNFDLRFILVWICVSICVDPHFRNLSNDDVRTLFYK